jgi:hypothetical protein
MAAPRAGDGVSFTPLLPPPPKDIVQWQLGQSAPREPAGFGERTGALQGGLTGILLEGR